MAFKSIKLIFFRVRYKTCLFIDLIRSDLDFIKNKFYKKQISVLMISQNLASDAVHQICPSLSKTPAYPTASPSTLIPAKKKPGRKRTKLSKTAQLLANLPTGFTFIGPLGQCNETYILAELKD